MKIITAGSPYLDIDAYAGCAVYAELLKLQGEQALFASTALLNESIPPSLRALPVTLERGYQPKPEDSYILIDVSEPGQFDAFVDEKHVEAIIDHHPGREDYWRHRLGERAQIEQVGAAATQVYECWQRAGLADKMSIASATLLAAAILDNTLYFGASVTTSRDHQAYAQLAQHAELPSDWPEQYFSECEQLMLADVSSAVVNDKKIVTFDTFVEKVAAGQLAIWDARPLLEDKLLAIKEPLEHDGLAWFMNLISISEGKSYFYTTVPVMRDWLAELLGAHFDGDIAMAERMWLRKEIRRQDLDRAATLSRAE